MDLCGRRLEHPIGPIEIRPVPGDPLNLPSAPHVEAVAEVLAGGIRAAERGAVREAMRGVIGVP